MEYNLFKDDITVTIAIILCIAFVSTIYIGLGLFINYEMDEYLYDDKHKNFNEEYVHDSHLLPLIFNMASTFSMLMIIAFFVKNVFDITIAQNINIGKFESIYELYTGSVLVIVLVTFSQVLNKQYKDVKKKIFGRIY
jgi:hypothetical protein